MSAEEGFEGEHGCTGPGSMFLGQGQTLEKGTNLLVGKGRMKEYMNCHRMVCHEGWTENTFAGAPTQVVASSPMIGAGSTIYY